MGSGVLLPEGGVAALNGVTAWGQPSATRGSVLPLLRVLVGDLPPGAEQKSHAQISTVCHPRGLQFSPCRHQGFGVLARAGWVPVLCLPGECGPAAGSGSHIPACSGVGVRSSLSLCRFCRGVWCVEMGAPAASAPLSEARRLCAHAGCPSGGGQAREVGRLSAALRHCPHTASPPLSRHPCMSPLPQAELGQGWASAWG